MCDECSYCYRSAALARELREDENGELTCSDCFDGSEDEWLAMPTVDELADMWEAAQDDKAHALAERAAERRMAA